MKSRKVNKGPPTMVRVLHVLTREDWLICCFQLRQKSDRYPDMHLGLLPFVAVDHMLQVLKMNGQTGVGHAPTRRLVELAAKIKSVLPDDNQGELLLKLSHAKVIERFGVHPERGKPFPWLGSKRVTVGFKWSLPLKDYVPDDDVHVAPCVALKLVGKDLYRVSVEPKYRARVEYWLVNFCR